MKDRVWRLWSSFVEPHPSVVDAVDRRRSRLLSSQLLVVMILVLIGAVTELLGADDFITIAPLVGAAWLVAFLSYTLARRGCYQTGAMLTAVMTISVCFAIVVQRPQDPVWEGFITLAILFASIFVSTARIALLSGFAVCATVGGVILTPTLRPVGVGAPIIFYQLIMVGMIVLTRAHYATLERERRAQDLATQTRLDHAQRVELFGRLAGGIAHDFNNILQLVSLGASELQHSEQLSPEEREAIVDIMKASSRGSRLTQRLMQIAKQEEEPHRVFDLAFWLRETLPSLERDTRGGASLELLSDVARLEIRANETQVRQVLENLIRNAVDASGDDAVIKIRLDELHLTQSEAQHMAFTPGVYAQLNVQDFGSGMDEQTLGRIFEPFYTTRGSSTGTGLGLASVWAILQQQGGHISAQSRPGEGSTFQVLWPVVR